MTRLIFSYEFLRNEEKIWKKIVKLLLVYYPYFRLTFRAQRVNLENNGSEYQVV